jgi:glycosyltransferase involved in cell wall biosynthesis
VVLDTATHAAYFARAFGLAPGKLRRLWVGSDDDVMRPAAAPPPADALRVVFYGSYVPLQGVEQIVQAAWLLERAGTCAQITLVGAGQTLPEVRALAERLGVRSVRFRGAIPYESLPSLMASSDVCLGIFGQTPKAGRVIPNKVFEALACARAVITANTPAVREALVHRRTAWLCDAGSADSLADAILTLYGDSSLRALIAQAGYETFRSRFSLQALRDEVAALVRDLVDAPRVRA